MINTNKILNSNAVKALKHYYKDKDFYQNMDKESMIKTDVFLSFYHDGGSLLDYEDVDFYTQEGAYRIMDICDYWLRANEDDDVLVLTEDDLIELLIQVFYKCKSNNDYDYNYLFYNLNRCDFIENLEQDNLINYKKINDLYYVWNYGAIKNYLLNNGYNFKIL